jgi:molybdopterin-guanine dinucleotide biosynthesis protein A
MGTDKLLLDIGGETFSRLDCPAVFRKIERVFVSLARPEKYPELNLPRIPDIFPVTAPSAGLHAALRVTAAMCFWWRADLPLSTPEAAERVISFAAEGHAVPCRWTPLAAMSLCLHGIRRVALRRWSAAVEEGSIR